MKTAPVCTYCHSVMPLFTLETPDTFSSKCSCGMKAVVPAEKCPFCSQANFPSNLIECACGARKVVTGWVKWIPT